MSENAFRMRLIIFVCFKGSLSTWGTKTAKRKTTRNELSPSNPSNASDTGDLCPSRDLKSWPNAAIPIESSLKKRLGMSAKLAAWTNVTLLILEKKYALECCDYSTGIRIVPLLDINGCFIMGFKQNVPCPFELVTLITMNAIVALFNSIPCMQNHRRHSSCRVVHHS